MVRFAYSIRLYGLSRTVACPPIICGHFYISPVGYAARTLKLNVSYHDLKYPVCRAKINLVHYAVRVAYPTFFNLNSGVTLMSHFRRAYVPGGSFFFTVVTERRAPIFCTDTSRLFLRTAIRECQRRWPFRIDAMVLLDNHLHAILTLPEGDTRYSARRGWIKKGR
jgi:hypothetical protein